MDHGDPVAGARGAVDRRRAHQPAVPTEPRLPRRAGSSRSFRGRAPRPTPTSFVEGLDARRHRGRSSRVVGIVRRAARSTGSGLRDAGDDPVDEQLGRFAKVLGNAYYFDDGDRRASSSGPVTPAAELPRPTSSTSKVIDGAVNGIGGWSRDCRRRPAQGADRPRAQATRSGSCSARVACSLLPRRRGRWR